MSYRNKKAEKALVEEIDIGVIQTKPIEESDDLESQGYVRESISNEGNQIIELWHHPCFPHDKDNGKCTHTADSGAWKEVRK